MFRNYKTRKKTFIKFCFLSYVMLQRAVRYTKGGLLLFICFCCTSWGYLVHRTVNQLAIYVLPTDMAPFFYENMDYLVKESVAADQRRNRDPKEAGRHIINFEAYDKDQLGAWKMPFSYEAALKKYGRDSLGRFGYLPYQVVMTQQRLTAAFKAWDRDSILFHAADLAHYISDAHVPLHTTSNYDGQLTSQEGLHALWESMLPELYLDQYQLYTKYKVTYIKNPAQAIWDALRSSHILVNDVLRIERLVAKDFPGDSKYRVQVRKGKTVKTYNTAFARAFHQRMGKTVNMQLLLSVNLVADFWYTAWVDAGEPSLEVIMDKKAPKRTRLKAEKAAHKNNTLIKNGYLLSRAKAGQQSQVEELQ